MNRLVPFVFLGFAVMSISGSLSAQDYIIRIYGDTIHCKVDNSTDRFVYYRTSDTRRGQQEIMSKKEIDEIVYNVNPNPREQLKAWKDTRKFNRLELGADGGYSRVFNVENVFGTDFDEYYDKLANGTYFHGHLVFNFNENLGLGVAYSHSEYSNKVDVVLIMPGNITLTGLLSDDRTIDYYAANLSYRPMEFQSGNRINITLGLGLLRFVSSSQLVYPYRLEARTLGAHLAAAFELSLGGGFYLPLRVGVRGFSLYGIDLEASEDMPDDLRNDLQMIFGQESAINLSRVELGAGLTFTF